ncbi:MAG: hypothetical protein ABIJ75_04630, partial [Actinomycetota bacterium]
EEPDMDILDKVLLSQNAVNAWLAACDQAATACHVAGLLGGEPPPDEVAEVQDDGSLLILGRIAGMELRLTIPAGEWAWAPREVQ